MSRPRTELRDIFKEILGNDHVYFQPPTNTKIEYPCIIYKKDNEKVDHADNRLYIDHNRYQVTIIDKNPDSRFPMKLRELDFCSFNRSFTSDNLHHFVYNIYY